MPRATWNGTLLAESPSTVMVDGNHYFPPDSIQLQHLKKTDTHTTCYWKGQADYFDVVVNDQVNKDAAWCYPTALPEAKHLEGHFAFWKGVQIES